MNIEQFLSEFEGWGSEERRQIASVWPLLSPPSKQTLKNFQRDWDGSRPYSEFVVEQNKQIRLCLELELSEAGAIIRTAAGVIPSLALDTEIPTPKGPPCPN